jgi:hypothetical protein
MPMPFTEPIESPIQVGSMLYTLVDPHVGFEKAYNRWYERDHFYAGCMVGPWLFAGRRWVSTRTLKALRFPADSPVAQPVTAGSYVAVYWHLKHHKQDHNAWANPQVHWLYSHGRGFPQRTHVHTLIYDHAWTCYRDEDPVPLELSLDHPYAGLATVMIKRQEGVDVAASDAWLADYLPGWLAGSPVASASAWTPPPPAPGGPGAPMPLPALADPERVTTLLFFLEADPHTCWDQFRTLGRDFDHSGLGRVIFATAFLPTLVGTDKYTDELW